MDRINYIHFNYQRLTNLTRDAITGLSEQLAPTSLMTIQNRMALDLLLAEKGGVCIMIGSSCCTFIPDNTAPDGSGTRALDTLRTVLEKLTKCGWDLRVTFCLLVERLFMTCSYR